MKKLGFGLMRLPLLDPEKRDSIDIEQVKRMVDRFLERGFTYFDTAYPYHDGVSEAAARQVLVERHPRDAFLLADKMPTWMIRSPADYPKYFAEQLERCGVDYFDYYLLHSLGEKNYADSLKHGGFDFLRRMKAAGKIRRMGFSYHDKADLLDRILTEQPDVEFVQLQINYIDWDSASIESRRCYEVATRHGKPVIVMEPVKGGSLAQVPEKVGQLFDACSPAMSPASWAIRYCASLENVAVVLSGMSDMAQLEENTDFMQDFRPLNAGEQATLARAVNMINGSIAIPCTECAYCVADCPQNIPIPQYFSLYNNQCLFGLMPMHANYYMNLTETHGSASACVACRRCEGHCPQHLEIVEHLEAVAGVFEAR